MHWFGLSEITWLAIVVIFAIVAAATAIFDRLARIAVLLEGIYAIPWKQAGGPGRLQVKQ
jgi:hypothetical protein